jgi:prepilin-type N-terminal cleavage/methylation domain-containing protein
MRRDVDQRTQNGMTLIEVMLALLIFSVGILGVAAMQITSIKCHRSARAITRDAFAASGQLELLSVMPFHHDWLVDRDGGYRQLMPDHGPFRRANERATIAWEVGAALPVPDAKRIAVTAYRSLSGSSERKLTYECVKAESYETRLLLRYRDQTGR